MNTLEEREVETMKARHAPGKLLVGLVGKARVGKDTAAEFLQREYGMAQYAFADPLKDMLETAFGDLFRGGDREQPIDWLGKSPRQLMQTLGTEWGRDCVHPDLWVLLAAQAWRSLGYTRANGMVISDVRFDNEADWIFRSGGHLIEIQRDVSGVSEHRSEKGLSSIFRLGHWVVTNDGSIEDLYSKLGDIMSVIWRP
ncbi:hypothetical protein D9M69_564580 [compost metagenome]